MVFDLRPVMYVVCLVLSHDIAEQLSRPSKLFKYSVTKSPTVRTLQPTIGSHSILTQEVSLLYVFSLPFRQENRALR